MAVRKNTNVTLAELIHEAQPYQRLIVIFREPVSRYYSAFHYYGCVGACSTHVGAHLASIATTMTSHFGLATTGIKGMLR